MNHSNGNRSSFTGILGGLALGALAMYMFDPVQGNRRRAEVRDKLQGMKEKSRNVAEARYRDAKGSAQASAARTHGVDEGAADAVQPAPGEMSQSNSAP